ncbi:hypothetical protein MKK88_07495 [Methylobacterium sp. E-005]|uniref:hypothetical protein n=1 Tax=Methylobacterium sp. E-005 TaxID=2836549 RepID=UPI001FBAF6B2|nr:hypothetical protein [Methylobacterium sp. E-005]MCJ2085836.1 hypothetical protein [Methylobacterium sp. E-005]
MIVPLRSKRDEVSALASFDATATELLAKGRAPTLSAAQFDAILMTLLRQRAELLAILANLEARASSRDARIEAINAELCVEARNGLAYIELFIQHAGTSALTARQGSRSA